MKGSCTASSPPAFVSAPSPPGSRRGSALQPSERGGSVSSSTMRRTEGTPRGSPSAASGLRRGAQAPPILQSSTSRSARPSCCQATTGHSVASSGLCRPNPARWRMSAGSPRRQGRGGTPQSAHARSCPTKMRSTRRTCRWATRSARSGSLLDLRGQPAPSPNRW